MNTVIDDKMLPHIEYVKSNTALDHNYLNMKIVLPRGEYEDLHFAVVKRSKINTKVQPMGIENNNPILDTRHTK